MSKSRNNRDVSLTGLTVVIVANSNNPTILNQDFLYHNGIVPKNWTLSANSPPIITPAFSQITFNNGFKMLAEPNRVIFEQLGSQIQERDIICADIAKRYLLTIPHVPYASIGINPQGYRILQNQTTDTISGLLIKKGDWMNFKDVSPNFQLKAVYQYNDKTVTIDIIESIIKGENDINIPTMVFNANIHRDISGETNQQMRINKLLSILDSYSQDISEFCLLTEKFKAKSS